MITVTYKKNESLLKIYRILLEDSESPGRLTTRKYLQTQAKGFGDFEGININNYCSAAI